MRISGNNSTNVPAGGVYFGNIGTNVLNISGGRIYGHYASGNNLEDPYYANTAVGVPLTPPMFHALRSFDNITSNNTINIVEYDHSSSDFGSPATISILSTLPDINTNNTIRVWNNGEDDNSLDW